MSGKNLLQRYVTFALSVLLIISLVGNLLLLNSTTNSGSSAVGGGFSAPLTDSSTPTNTHGGGEACPVCKPCAANTLSKDDNTNGAKASPPSNDRDSSSDASSSGSSANNVNGVPESYRAHGLRSVYDEASPVHTIVQVKGVGPMVAVATPVWRLVPSNGGGRSSIIDDDVPAPGQVVGTEKPASGGGDNDKDGNTNNKKQDGGDGKGNSNDDDSSSSSRKLLAMAPGYAAANSIPPPSTLQLWAPKDITRLSIDVGTFLTSPSSKRWWYWDSKAMVVAFEPNIVSGMLLTRISHPAFNTQLQGYWPACPTPKWDSATNAFSANEDGPINRQVQLDNLHSCLNKSYGHITSRMDRFVLFPVALSNADEYANFQYGFPGRADSGSLLAFNKQLIKKRQGAKPLFALPTPVMKMASILALLPKTRSTDGSKILWDTLKIDAQGVDSLIIEGAGHLLKNFACVLGEFDASGYKGARKFDYRAYLVYELGFIMLKRTTFVNPAFADVVHSKRALCFSSDVAVDYGKLGHVIAKLKASGKYPTQREHPELSPIDRG